MEVIVGRKRFFSIYCIDSSLDVSNKSIISLVINQLMVVSGIKSEKSCGYSPFGVHILNCLMSEL